MKKIMILMILIHYISLTVFAEKIDLKIVTENLPPYNFKNNQEIVGMSTDIVNLVLKTANFVNVEEIDAQSANKNIYSTEINTWARSYREAMTQKNVCIYSIIRTPERDKKLIFISKLTRGKYGFFTLRNKSIRLNTLKDARKYKIGVVHDWVTDLYLKKQKNFKLFRIPYPRLLENFLTTKRVDLIFTEANFFNYLMNKNNNKKKFKEIKIKHSTKDFEALNAYQWFACNRKTDVNFIIRLTDAFNKINKISSKIIQKWQ